MNEKDEKFLENSSKLLDTDKWGKFLLNWAETLESYGTPTSFVDVTGYKFDTIEFNNKKYPFVYTLSENYAQRRVLMEKQKDYINKLKGDMYGLNLDLKNCFICQNVVQGIDSQIYPEIKNNVMYWLGEHAILPNRYPNQLGHSLSDIINHDDITNRVIPKPDPDNPKNKTAIYEPERKKTRGAIITSQYLDAVMASCDSLNLVGIRNHVLDGMSIPGHDHFHLIPEDLPSVSLIKEVLGEKQQTDYEDIYQPENTSFDTLVITNDNRKKISEIACPILEKMEKDNQVFTLFYHKGNFLISPRFNIENKRIQIGGGVPVHYFDTLGQEYIDRINKYVPMKGQYNWSKFIL